MFQGFLTNILFWASQTAFKGGARSGRCWPDGRQYEANAARLGNCSIVGEGPGSHMRGREARVQQMIDPLYVNHYPPLRPLSDLPGGTGAVPWRYKKTHLIGRRFAR